jgi:hypothetical protein
LNRKQTFRERIKVFAPTARKEVSRPDSCVFDAKQTKITAFQAWLAADGLGTQALGEA